MVRTERTFTLFTSDLCQFLSHVHTGFWHIRTEVNRSGVSSQGAFWRRRFHFIRLTTFLIWSDLHNKDSQTHSHIGWTLIKKTQPKTMWRGKKEMNVPDLRQQILLWDYHLCLARASAPLGMNEVQGLPLEED